MPTLSDFEATTIDGKEQELATYDGDVVLVVNVASECGFTPQYEGLQALYQTYADRGFVVLGFPCDQFGHQEPGTEEEIAGFCERTYGVTFPMFAKIDVNGDDAAPLYRWLRDEAGDGADVRWNFTKFLLARDGSVLARFDSRTEPADLVDVIEEQLAVSA